jgi:hypothetical protein
MNDCDDFYMWMDRQIEWQLEDQQEKQNDDNRTDDNE